MAKTKKKKKKKKAIEISTVEYVYKPAPFFDKDKTKVILKVLAKVMVYSGTLVDIFADGIQSSRAGSGVMGPSSLPKKEGN